MKTVSIKKCHHLQTEYCIIIVQLHGSLTYSLRFILICYTFNDHFHINFKRYSKLNFSVKKYDLTEERFCKNIFKITVSSLLQIELHLHIFVCKFILPVNEHTQTHTHQIPMSVLHSVSVILLRIICESELQFIQQCVLKYTQKMCQHFSIVINVMPLIIIRLI